MTNKTIVLLSPLIIVSCGTVVALVFGSIIGKWVFIPLVLTLWTLFAYFIYRYSESAQRKKWLAKSRGAWGWSVLALVVGLIPFPLILNFYALLAPWTIWLPWLLLAIINPWLEEFYWRGLLLDYTVSWKKWQAVLYSSGCFCLNHITFGINSEMCRGWDFFLSLFIMGIVWAVVYQKTKSLRWCIFSHFLVDLFNLSAVAFLDLLVSHM
ncbi:MAG: CPBP family intramembrane glutamic endopeptidase [Bacteroidota bacterium]